MKMVSIEHHIVHQCTNKNCTNYSSGSSLGGKPELMDIFQTLGEPEPCRRCNTGMLVVKRAYFKKSKPPSYATKEFRFLVRCEKCDATWTAIALTPVATENVGTMEFLKRTMHDKVRCRFCSTTEHTRILQVTQLS